MMRGALPLLTSHHAAETQMVRTSGNLTFATGADDVTRAILIRAEKGTPAMNFLRLTGFRRIEWMLWALRIARHLAVGGQGPIIFGSVPITRPLPYVARHVVQPVRIRGIMSDRRGAPKTVLSRVGVRKMPLVRVSHPLSVRTEFISPHEGFSGLATSRREFPFRFGRQTFSSPLRVSHRIFIRHLYHRIILLPTNAALRPF